LASYFRRRKEWEIEVLTALRIRVRRDWIRIPDFCTYTLPALLAHGVLLSWIINPETLDSELRTPAGIKDVPKTLSVVDSPIVVPLLEVVEE
jgi:hypothetical protein